MKNNLFNFATSELSQDAFICWLLSFAKAEHKDEDQNLYKCAIEVLEIMVPGLQTYEVEKITRQYKNIDVLVELEKHVIIIEDKTYTGQHGNQISKYRETIVNDEKSKDKDVVCVYFKISDQAKPEEYPKTEKDPESEIKIINITRNTLLSIFAKYKGLIQNDVFIYYLEHLENIERQTKEYKTKPMIEWTDNAYRGFFTHLVNDTIIDTSRDYSWDYVPNQTGGFWGLWWFFLNESELEKILPGKKLMTLYLQIENDVIAVKIEANDNFSMQDRWDLYEKIQKKLPEFKKRKFRMGTSMTVGYLEYNEANYKEKIKIMQDTIIAILNNA